MSSYQYDYHPEVYFPARIVASIGVGIVAFLCSGVYYCCCYSTKTRATPIRNVAIPQRRPATFAPNSTGGIYTPYHSTIPDPSSNRRPYPATVPNTNEMGACYPANTPNTNVIISIPNGTPCPTAPTAPFEKMYQDAPPTYDQIISSIEKHNSPQ